MAAVYSRRFIAVQGLNGSATYSVPDGFTAVLVDFSVYASTGVSDTRHVFLIGHSGQTIAQFTWLDGTQNSSQWRGRQVIDQDEVVTVTTDAPVDVSLSGYLLTLP